MLWTHFKNKLQKILKIFEHEKSKGSTQEGTKIKMETVGRKNITLKGGRTWEETEQGELWEARQT